MIFDAIITNIFNLFTIVVSYFPDGDADIALAVEDSIYNIKGWIANYNWIFPADTFFTLINLYLVAIGAVLTFIVARWLISILTNNLIH